MHQARKNGKNSNEMKSGFLWFRKGMGVRTIGWSTLLRGGPIIALLLLVLYFSLTSPHFASIDNLKNIGEQNAYLIILAVGQTMVIIGAGIDLSVGAVMAVSASIMAVLATQSITFMGISIGPLSAWEQCS